MEPIAKLKSYINSAIPYAWDDSESWFEFLAKINQKLNEVIDKNNEYFDVDLPSFAKDILTGWLHDGTLNIILSDATDEALGYYTKNIVNVLDNGVIGDGTDETAAMQLALNKAALQNGVFYVPPGVTVSISQIELADKSNFTIDIQGALKKIGGAPPGTRLIHLNRCSNFKIPVLNADGNVLNNGVTLSEDQHVLLLTNCSNAKIGSVTAKNLAGDCIYIGAGSHDILFDSVVCNSDNTGRNAVSIVSAERLQFNMVSSIGVGTSFMPGGVDIEPNTINDHCRDIQFGSMFIDTKGTSAFSMNNNPGAICENITCNSFIVHKRESDNTNFGVYINNFKNVNITGSVKEIRSTPALLKTEGIRVNSSENITGSIDIENVLLGARLGNAGQCNKINMNLKIKKTYLAGVAVVDVANSILTLNITDANIAEDTVNGGLTLTGVQTNVTYKGFIEKISNGNFAVRNSSASRPGCSIELKYLGFSPSKYVLNLYDVNGMNNKKRMWINPALTNEWVNKAGDELAYARGLDGSFYLKGTITGGIKTSGTQITTTDLVLYPANNKYFPVIGGGSVVLQTDGVLKIHTDIVGEEICFDGMTADIE